MHEDTAEEAIPMSDEKIYKPCPYCREEILEDAVKCRYCQSILLGDPGEQIAEPRGKVSTARYPRADLGKRFIAWLVDSIVAGFGAIFILLFLLLSGIGGLAFMRGFPPRTTPFGPGPFGFELFGHLANIAAPALLIGALLFFLLGGAWAILYTLFKDGLGSGQSLGKRLLGLRVVKLETGEPCTFGVSALRNLTLIVQHLVPHVGFLIEPIATLAQAKGQRLGDLLANTQVIEIDRRGASRG